MKPVVTSIVALAIAIAPFAAWAEKPHANKPTPAHVAKPAKKPAKADDGLLGPDKGDKAKSNKPAAKIEAAPRAGSGKKPDAVTKVSHKKKETLKPVLHHAHGADMSGPGHQEPGTPSVAMHKPHGKLAHVSHTRPAELPKLPAAATKSSASKAGHEKGAKKGAAKKSEPAASSDDGQLERDEDFADLVARIRGKHVPAGKQPSKGKTCEREAVEIIRGPETDTFALLDCNGKIAPLAIERLSIAIRPGGAARPIAPASELAKKKGDELAPGVHRVDERLARRVQAVVDHFAKSGSPVKISIVSGYRPTSIGSMHASGRAIDFRLEGAKNEDVVAFCKTLDDTGCGYYPNSSFVHLDVRDSGAGHVSWIDASGPGETPRYVPSWPPPVSKGEPRGAKSDELAPVSAREPVAPSKVDRDGDVEVFDQLPAPH